MNRETLIYHIMEFSTNLQTNKVWLGKDYFDLLLSPYKDQVSIDFNFCWYRLNHLIFIGCDNHMVHTIGGYKDGIPGIEYTILIIDPVTQERVKPKHKNIMFTS